MPHVRETIHGSAKTAVTGLPTTAARVYVGRSRALATGHAPTLLLYVADEVSETDSMGRPKKLRREMTLTIEGRVSTASAEAAEETLDDIALEVEPAIAGNTFGGTAKDTVLVTTRKSVIAEGEHHLGSIQLEFRVTYRTIENAPGSAIS